MKKPERGLRPLAWQGAPDVRRRAQALERLMRNEQRKELQPFLDRAEAEMTARQSEWFRVIFATEGPLRRELYRKHMTFFAAGAVKDAHGKYHFTERAFIAANRSGKTEAGAFETVCHLTGAYPPWWPGRRYTTPVDAWVAGDTGKTTRDILQQKLMGPPTAPGTGMLPKRWIIDTAAKAGVAGAIETIWVSWKDNRVDKDHGARPVSVVGLKSYDQRREAFQGTSMHFIWLDEEVPEDIYTECLLRIMVLPNEEQLAPADRQMGMLMLTFTPLMGLTPVVLSFLPGGAMVEGEVTEAA